LLEKYSIQILGDENVTKSVRHVEAKYIELSNYFIELKTDFENIKENIQKKTNKVNIELAPPPKPQQMSQIFHISPMSEDVQPPDFLTKRLESAIIKEGKKYKLVVLCFFLS
jgi:hypothetical protein